MHTFIPFVPSGTKYMIFMFVMFGLLAAEFLAFGFILDKALL